MKQACEGANLLIHAIPAQNTFDFLTLHRDNIPSNIPLVSTSKGIYTKTLQMMSEVIPEALGRAQPLAYLSGPSFAKDMMENSGSIAVVVASEDQEIAKFVAESLSSTDFRCYRTDDVIGVEVGGALKNPLAIMSGMLQGSGAGPSTSAAMITRGCEEMRQLAIAMGGRPETLAGLSGIGDLILTASSSLSRNFTVGFRVAKGETLEQIIESMGEVAEGVPTTTIVPQLLEKYNLDLPIFLTTQRVLAGELNFEQAKEAVMNRPLKREDGRED
jgi:glycerol-3-phosphate dehydrogenase (NAD+)